MKRGHLIKEEISVYFRIAFQGRVAAGTGRCGGGGKREAAGDREETPPHCDCSVNTTPKSSEE
jgi:hypothetical protein